MNKFSKTLRDNWIFLLMVLPGALWLVLFFYIPVFGNVVAFKDYHMTSNGFIDSIMNSKWVGLDNFRFLFSSRDAFIITRNTVLYNLGFIFIGLIVSVGIAIILSELRSKRMVKIFQTSMLPQWRLPRPLSCSPWLSLDGRSTAWSFRLCHLPQARRR